MATSYPPGSNRPPILVREVWRWNFSEEFQALSKAVAGEAAAVVALDTEFPGFLEKEPHWTASQEVRYRALRENVDPLRPIQVGLAVASASGVVRGAWSFNLQFDLEADKYTEASVEFLRRAGLDFDRHAAEGLDAALLGRKLKASCLVGVHRRAPTWLTFAGAYDFGFLLQLLTHGRPLPAAPADFRETLEALCPRRRELRDQLPHGSLASLGVQLGVARSGRAHTAGSDALLTLEIHVRLRWYSESLAWCYQDFSQWNSWPATWGPNTFHPPALGLPSFWPPLAPCNGSTWN